LIRSSLSTGSPTVCVHDDEGNGFLLTAFSSLVHYSIIHDPNIPGLLRFLSQVFELLIEEDSRFLPRVIRLPLIGYVQRYVIGVGMRTLDPLFFFFFSSFSAINVAFVAFVDKSDKSGNATVY
jgi:hypothetical protein